jgi:uncharacterized cupredoxin-like copper-binding protein
MTLRKTRSLVLLFAALAFALAACGGTAAASSDDGVEDHVEAEADHDDRVEDHVEAESDHDDEAEHDAEEFTFGSPADASDADRVIEVDANDSFTFGPADLVVSAGETITFVVTNTGNIPHDFTLGDQETQDKHAAEMAEMMAGGEMAHDDHNAVAIGPGETKELTWHFSEAGTLIIGCHQPGHYAAGMVGAVTVEA